MSIDRYAKQRIFSVSPAAIHEASTSRPQALR